jgi:hypothetical protein
MHEDYGLGPKGDRGYSAFKIKMRGLGLDVDKHRSRTGLDHRGGRWKGSHRGQNNLIPRRDSYGSHAEDQGICAAGDGYGAPAPMKGAQLGFKGSDLWAQDVHAPRHHGAKKLGQFVGLGPDDRQVYKPYSGALAHQ